MMNNMKLGTHATEPITLLISVLAEASTKFVKFNSRLFDVDENSIVLNIDAEHFPRIAKFMRLKPKYKIAGCFGYQSDPGRGPELFVCFYCRQSEGPAAANRRIRARLLSAGFNEKEFPEDDLNVYVVCKAEESTDDKEWFTKVLNAFEK